MSLVIREVEIGGFRKFRAPFVIDGLTEGFNIVIEPNETGKSTLLEALRAAFFVRHKTTNRLAQSFAPYGEAVGPEIRVAFEVDSAPWSVKKRFLRSPSVEVTGPHGRAQGEDAESWLSGLFGSVRDTSRDRDLETYGALGMLWVGQNEAMSVSAPSQIVRETVTSTLEAEVGSIMGGAAYARVRDRIDAQYALYWSPTGQKRERQREASNRVEAATAAATAAADRLAALELSFAALDDARARLRLLQRDIQDDSDAQQREALVVLRETARATAQILSTRRAEHEAAGARVAALADIQQRHTDARGERNKAAERLASVRGRRAEIAGTVTAARQKLVSSREALELAREAREQARSAQAEGEEHLRRNRRRSAAQAAHGRHAELLALEERHRVAKAIAGSAVPIQAVGKLEKLDRLVAQAEAMVKAGATRISLLGVAAGVSIDGEPMPMGELTLTRETRIRFGDAELLINPPASAASAEEVLASAIRDRKVALDDLAVSDLAEVRTRNEAARDAVAELRTLEARIEMVTQANEIIPLAAGPDALKLFVAGLGEVLADSEGIDPDIAELARAVEVADELFARAEGARDGAVEALRRAEEEDAPLAAEEAGARSDVANATAAIAVIEARPEWADLIADLAEARKRAARVSLELEEAVCNASAHDVSAITRKIDTIDARARAAAEARGRLETDIARLEGTIESEGGLGLADRAAAAREEAEAALSALQRVTEEADTLKLLRDTLEEARSETSARFVGPVALRAKRHVERLLPGADLSFSEALSLECVIRAGFEESCASLSRGTQEQLAILTRIAFGDMLLEQGKPVSLILDDPLVYSDDRRLDLMLEILSEAATRMQVILLTCRDRAFRHVAGNRIELGTSG